MPTTKTRAGVWVSMVHANAGVQIRYEGRTLELTGQEFGSNRTGEHFLRTTTGEQVPIRKLVQHMPLGEVTKILRAGLDVAMLNARRAAGLCK